jgi:nucleoside-diphosphate-sugar epimerase
MNVLVTGASGFLGGHVVEQLSKGGHDVRVLARKTSNTKFLRTLDRVEIVQGSIEQADRVAEAVEGIDAVVHSAGIVKARTPDDFVKVNVGGTSNLIQAARKRGKGKLKRFVHVSSLEACGPSSDGKPVPEEQENPVTAYGRSKLAAEKIVLSAKDDLPVTILRPGAIYGPRDHEILEAFKSIQRGLLPLVAGGESLGMYIYAPDCAAACIRAIDAHTPSGSIYFVDDGSGGISQKQMLADAERALGRKALVRMNLPMGFLMGVARGVEVFGRIANKPVMLTREKAQMLMQHWVCSSDRTRADLGWEPKVPWSEGVKLAVAWYRDNGWL